jgi:HEAT repeats
LWGRLNEAAHFFAASVLLCKHGGLPTKTAYGMSMSSYCRRGSFLLILAISLSLCGCWKNATPDDELMSELVHKDFKQRRTAALCIREMRPVPEIYIPPLIKALNDQDPEVRQTAAEALGEVGIAGRPFLNDLAKLSNEHNDTQVRVALQRSVEKINHSQ